jgi:hypothetical protein
MAWGFSSVPVKLDAAGAYNCLVAGLRFPTCSTFRWSTSRRRRVGEIQPRTGRRGGTGTQRPRLARPVAGIIRPHRPLESARRHPRLDGAPTGRTGATLRFLIFLALACRCRIMGPCRPLGRKATLAARRRWRSTKPTAEVLQIRQPTSLKVGRVAVRKYVVYDATANPNCGLAASFRVCPDSEGITTMSSTRSRCQLPVFACALILPSTVKLAVVATALSATAAHRPPPISPAGSTPRWWPLDRGGTCCIKGTIDAASRRGPWRPNRD